jgi:hypothetical protein
MIMNLLQNIINYDHGEARHGFWAAIIGGLLLISSIVLWKWASPLPLLRGFAVPMLLFGLIMGIGGAADNIYTKKSTTGKIALYQKDSTAFLKQEKVKTEKTHRGWHGIRIFLGHIRIWRWVAFITNQKAILDWRWFGNRGFSHFSFSV